MVNLDEVTKLEQTVFKIEKLPRNPFERYPNLIASVSFEMSQDLQIIKRLHYSLLDMLADVGGLNRTLSSFYSIVALALGFQSMDTFLSSKLFKLDRDDKKGESN